jgi:hypothetical protein
MSSDGVACWDDAGMQGIRCNAGATITAVQFPDNMVIHIAADFCTGANVLPPAKQNIA